MARRSNVIMTIDGLFVGETKISLEGMRTMRTAFSECVVSSLPFLSVYALREG